MHAVTESELRVLRDSVRSRIDMSGSVTDRELQDVIEDVLFRWNAGRPIAAPEKHRAMKRLFHSFRGLDLLQPLMDDPAVTEIMINAHDEIFIEKAGLLSRYPLSFESRERLEDLIQLIVSRVNRIVNESTPIVDARLPDGSRVHVVLPPVALRGPAMTIRKFPERPLTVDDLIERGALSGEAAGLLARLVRAKYNLFISGGTGAGKTTLLNALAQFIPADERIVTIEDSAELQIRGVPNLVSLETRNANTEGRGSISMKELIRASLRMRPNRVIVGEVRGAEALDMLQAMNTGHDGSISTGHANSSRDMISRLETMVLSGADLPLPVIRSQIASAVDILVHLSRLRDRTRRVTEIAEIAGVEGGEVRLATLYAFVEEGERDGRIVGRLEPAEGRLTRTHKLTMAGYKEEDAVVR